jgi:hypothetical protein
MNITLKDIPNELHESLRVSADRTGRSLNKFILITLERALTPQKANRIELLRRVKARRGAMKSVLTDDLLSNAIKEGRA